MADPVIVGCGYIGRRLLRENARKQSGGTVIGVARSETSLEAIRAAGGVPLQLDLDTASLVPLPAADAVVFHFAPPPSEGVRDSRTARLIAHFHGHGHPKRIVYISTTGVYGDCQGAWVDESWPVQPVAARSQRRADAERQLQDWSAASGRALIILRVAGIYAADRLPLERIRQGQPVVKADQAPWSNRIHADDLVQICIAAAERAPAGAIYNVCDGHPSTMTDYFLRVAEAAGLQAPPEIALDAASAQLSAAMVSYLSESRRLDNRRLREELGIRLRYPDLSAGLADLRTEPAE